LKKRNIAALCAALTLSLLLPSAPRQARAAEVSPHVVAAARAAGQEALLVRNAERYKRSRAWGVDQIYPAFGLNFAKYPREGIAHRNLLVVLADFPADPFGTAVRHGAASTPGYYNRLFFSDDPNDGIISLREFYRTNSHGRLIVSGRVTPGWVTMPHSYAYYTNGASGLDFGSYPRSGQGAAEAAMQAAYNSFDHNLGFFDNDGPDGIPSSGDDDGYIDATIVIHPGQGAEVAPPQFEPDLLWSHEAGISVYQDCPQPSSPNCLPGMLLGNVRGFLYTMNGEFNYQSGDNANGTYLHEFGHTLGLADLYEFSGCGNPVGSGLGIYSLMSLGNYLPLSPPEAQGRRPGAIDPWSRAFLGFEFPGAAFQSGQYTLPPLTQGGNALKVWKNGQPGTEYFLVENRNQEGLDAALPGSGLLVYHVDDTMIDNCRDCDNVSCLVPPAPHGRVKVVQADGLSQLETPSPPNYGGPEDFFPGSLGVQTWTQSTTPNTNDYAGGDTGIRMTNIVRAADGSVSFDLSVSIRPELAVLSVGVTDQAGNGNGILDNGETDSLAVLMQNIGTASGTLNFTLSTTDAGVTVVGGGSASTPAAAAGGGLAQNATPFVVTVGTYPTLPHAVPFTLGWTDGTTAGTLSFTLSVGMGTGLAEDFESGIGTWTTAAISPSTVNEWHLSTTRAYGGSATSMKVGSTQDPNGLASNDAKTYADNEDAVLVSPMFFLLPGRQLEFSSWIDAETNGGASAFDGARVEISLRGGPWMPLVVRGGYGQHLTFDSGASLRGEDVFSGSPQSWRRVVSDLAAFSGPVQIRFRFASNEINQPYDLNLGSLARYYEGWYVDAVSVRPRVQPGPPQRVLSFRAGPNPYRVQHGMTSAVTFRFSAPDGLPHPGLTPRVSIYDTHGRLVRTLDASVEPLSGNEFRASWNATTEKGGVASSGIYFAKVDILGQTQVTRLVLLR
jgi:M6 family metalloprotease-like protein